MRLKEIKEGSISLLIPDPEEYRKEGRFDPSWAPVFYNPRMVLNRDISVAFVKAMGVKSVVDSMSATGVRALRYKVEAGVDAVIANDRNPNAVELITKNAELNRVQITVYNRDANSLLYETKAEYVDLDPFGTPVPFLGSAIWASTRYLGVTATDLTALECASKSSARRKYDVVCEKLSFSKEVGIRVLLGKIAREAASLEKGVTPLLSFYYDYYYRVFLRVERGSGRAKRTLSNLGYYYECPKCGFRVVEHECKGDMKCPKCGSRMRSAGPLWTGKLGEEDVIGGVLQNVQSREEQDLLIQILSEVRYNEPYYDTDFLASLYKINPPRITHMVKCLGEATRTHFDKKGFKTNRGFEDVISCLDPQRERSSS